MKKVMLLLLSFGILIAPSVIAETVFYCQSELATGFIKKNGSWKVTNFESIRLTIKFNNDYSELFGLDSERPYSCSPAYPHKPNSLACLSGYRNGQSFLFNKEKRRFVFANPIPAGGYESNPSSADTDIMYAGTCKTF